MGPLEPVREGGGSPALTPEGQAPGPQRWAVWRRGHFSRGVVEGNESQMSESP